MTDFQIIELPNGIKCVHRQVKSPVAYCGLTINAGSRDELVDEHGLAHFIEHCFFKGTTKRRAYHINNRLENLGGELNAYTTKEETVVHATVLKSDYSKAVEIISDVVFNSTFPQHEVDKEKEIIVDEINSYKDSPSERIFDDYEDMLFASSSLGHNILGSKKSISKYTTDDILRFTRRTHNTDKIVFSSVGNISFNRFKDICERYLSDIPANKRVFQRDTVPAYKPFERVVNRGTHQAHCVMGARAYNNSDERRVALSLLTNMLGGSSANSILNVALRERHGLTYGVDASYISFSDTGMFTIYFGADRDNTERCISLINDELQKIIKENISTRQLSIAKKQFIGQLCIGMESSENVMLGAGKSFLVYGGVDNMEKMAERINALTRDDIYDVATDIFKSEFSTLIYK